MWESRAVDVCVVGVIVSAALCVGWLADLSEKEGKSLFSKPDKKAGRPFMSVADVRFQGTYRQMYGTGKLLPINLRRK